MLKLGDEKYQEKDRKIVFNGGKAGVVRNCSVRIEKRVDGENELAPKYKMYFTDENGAEINRGFFSPNIKSEKQDLFFMREMNHILKQCDVAIPKEQGFNTHEEILDFVMKSCKDIIKTQKFGVAVSYGTAKKPSSYLEVGGFWEFRNEKFITDTDPLILGKDALRERIEPKSPVKAAGDDWGSPSSNGASDMPF